MDQKYWFEILGGVLIVLSSVVGERMHRRMKRTAYLIFICVAVAYSALGIRIDQVADQRTTSLGKEIEELKRGEQKTGAGVEVLLQKGYSNVQVAPVQTPSPKGARLHVAQQQIYYPGPGKQIYDNVTFENLGDEQATAQIYSMSGVAKGIDEQVGVVQDLYSLLNGLVKEGGGLKYMVQPGPPGLYFTVFGPALSVEDQTKVMTGEYSAYFLAAMIYRDSRGAHRTDLCVYNHIPGVVLLCREHNDETQ